jgi:ribosomal-protein-alanine N-acetyltransferase
MPLSSSPKTQVGIRWMIPRDFPACCAMAQQIGPEDWRELWQEENFNAVMRDCRGILLVAETPDFHTVGFVAYALRKKHINLLNLVVHQDYRHQGIGAHLIARVQKKLRNDRRTIRAVVRDRDLAMQQFLRACGFRAVEVLHQHFFDDDDGYRMDLEGTNL